jgi:hypothetical protein
MNWEPFDERKKEEGGDSRYFSFSDWEIDFLVEELKDERRGIDEILVLRAILYCCKQLQIPFEREHFVQCLRERLGID